MKVGLTGATGFVARHLVPLLCARGHTVVAFVRRPGQAVPAGVTETRPLSPDAPPDVAGLDAIINLAGDPILGRWTAAKKGRVLASRLGTTERLVTAMRATPGGPRVLVSASAVGFYGDADDRPCPETAPAGTGFLSEVCVGWEAAAHRAEEFGARVACVRIGFVLGRDGGAFPLLRTAFRLCLGGRLGDGRQWMPPIHVADVAGIFAHLLEDPAARGAFNAACPEPIRNADFTRAVARSLGRPALLPAPGLALRLVMGEASHVVLDSARVLPEATLRAGYAFRFPTPGAILADLAR